MTRTTKTTKTRKAEPKEPSRKPAMSREAMLMVFREMVEDKVQTVEREYGHARAQFMTRFNDPDGGAADAIYWRGQSVVIAEFKAREWMGMKERLLNVTSPADILTVVERWTRHLNDKMYDGCSSREDAPRWVGEAAAHLLRSDLDTLKYCADSFAKTWDTAPATDQDAWDVLSATEKVEYLTWKTDTGRAYTAIEAAWTPQGE